MIVNKFGGDCLGKNGENALKTVEMLKGQLKTNNYPIVFVSALKEVTDKLIGINKDGVVNPEFNLMLESILDQYKTAGEHLELDENVLCRELNPIVNECKEVLAHSANYNIGFSDSVMHKTISLGERLSAHLLSELYKYNGILSEPVDPSENFPIAYDGNHDKIDEEESVIRTGKFLKDYLSGAIPVLPGFVATTKNNLLTTLGRGGSDLSAVIFSYSAKGCDEEVETALWKNTPYGVGSADHKIVGEENVRSISHLSFLECVLMASHGAKVVQDEAIKFARIKKLPLEVRSIRNPEKYTRISGEKITGPAVKCVTGSTDCLYLEFRENSTGPAINFLENSGVHYVFGKTHIPNHVDCSHAIVFDGELFRIEGIPYFVKNSRSDIGVVGIFGNMIGAPGVYGEVGRTLKDSGVNIISSYSAPQDPYILVAVSSGDVERGIRSLHKLVGNNNM